MGWLSSLQSTAARITEGNGFLIALVLAGISIAIGVGVGANWEPKTFLWLAIYLNVIYWVIGQGFGGLATGSATDPNAGLPFIVLAFALFTALPSATGGQSRHEHA
jgi:hypothetical protein